MSEKTTEKSDKTMDAKVRKTRKKKEKTEKSCGKKDGNKTTTLNQETPILTHRDLLRIVRDPASNPDTLLPGGITCSQYAHDVVLSWSHKNQAKYQKSLTSS